VGLLSNPPLNSILAGHRAFCDAAENVGEVAKLPGQTQHRLTSTEVDELVHAYERGESVPRLVALFGINRTTALAHLKRRDVATRANRRRLTNKTVQQPAALYTDGRSLAAIARSFDVDPSTVAKELRRAGISIRTARKVPRTHLLDQ
jgi:Helix-turn-helix domain